MLILVINAGSSSIKYKLFKLPGKNPLVKGILERIGEKGSFIHQQSARGSFFNKNVRCLNHRQAINLILSLLKDKKIGVLKDLKQISCVGHRVVHGGEGFNQPCFLNKDILEKIAKYAKLAPLHNPAAVSAIKSCIASLKGIPQIAVFDTAFHASLPKYAFVYGLPYELYSRLGIRRFGFHGTSHQYVAYQAAEVLKRPVRKLRIITCHLGNGCSITAVRFGKSIDTSLGFTPLEGLLMGTRAGDFDASIIFFLLKNNYTLEQIEYMLNHKSGLLGLSGISNDLRDLMPAIKKNNSRAKLARDIFVYRIQKYIGAYIAALGGLDALVFTAGIGENQKQILERICRGLKFLLKATGAEVLVIKTDEEYMIASQACQLLKHRNGRLGMQR